MDHKEIQIAQTEFSVSKPVIAIKPLGSQRTSTKVTESADKIVGWNTESISDGSWWVLGYSACFQHRYGTSSFAPTAQLNTGKFDVLQKLEEQLAYPFFTGEWELPLEGKDRKKYGKLSVVETFVPVIFFVCFAALFLTGIYLSANGVGGLNEITCVEHSARLYLINLTQKGDSNND